MESVDQLDGGREACGLDGIFERARSPATVCGSGLELVGEWLAMSVNSVLMGLGFKDVKVVHANWFDAIRD